MKVTVVKEVVKELEKYYVIRAIRDTGINKMCMAEKICKEKPTEEEIGMFLVSVKADFCSVVENYRFVDECEADSEEDDFC